VAQPAPASAFVSVVTFSPASASASTSTSASASAAAAASASALTSALALASAPAVRRPSVAGGVRVTGQQRRRQRARCAVEEGRSVTALQGVVRLVALTQRPPPLTRPVREGVTKPRTVAAIGAAHVDAAHHHAG
jgi:hypothetical protein